MAQNKFLSAQEAADALNISVSTLYAYVSRGLVRSEPTEGKSRARRYRAADIDALKKKQSYRHNPGRVAPDTLRHGIPVLDSSITLIQNGQLLYRGHDALELAQTKSFEEVASLLWTGEFESSHLFDQKNDLKFALPRPFAEMAGKLSPIEQFQTLLPLAAAHDLAGYDPSPAGIQRTGGRIIRLLTQIVTGEGSFDSITEALQKAWLPDHPELRPALEATLILCADHELNVSAFTARCVASAGTTLYQVVQGGLAAIQGFRHGGQSERVGVFFDEVAGNIPQKIGAYIKRGEHLPGFDHPLYPDGDSRGRLLFELAEKYQLDVGPVNDARLIRETVSSQLERIPNIDFALVTLSRALKLPADAPITLFALGRTAGWIAHALEQYESKQLIRPRARYVGVGSIGAD
ncbi:MAG: citrate synthase family protein [Anaerolineae bacterium]